MEMMKKFRNKASALGLALVSMVASGAAMAQAVAPDVTAIEDEIGVYKLAVVGLVITFAVVLWAIRAAGLLKPR